LNPSSLKSERRWRDEKRRKPPTIFRLRLIYEQGSVLRREAEDLSVLGINPFTVLGDIRGKYQLANFVICIFIRHKDNSFLRINYRMTLAFGARKKPGSKELPSLNP
jgi:hypothetical protein